MYSKLPLVQDSNKTKKRGKGNKKHTSFYTFKFSFWENPITNSKLDNLDQPSYWGRGKLHKTLFLKTCLKAKKALANNEKLLGQDLEDDKGHQPLHLPSSSQTRTASPLRVFVNSRRVVERLGNVSEKHSAKGTEVGVQGFSKDINRHTWDEDPSRESELTVGRPHFAEHVFCLRLFQSSKANWGHPGLPVPRACGGTNVNPQSEWQQHPKLYILPQTILQLECLACK